MKKLFLILGLFLSLCTNAWAQDDAEYYQHIKKSVKKFQDLIKTNNPQLIAQNVVYPFIIGENCPPLQNEEEFIQNYNIILSSELLSEIISSNKKLWHLDKNKDGIFYDSPYVQLSLNGDLTDLEYTFPQTHGAIFAIPSYACVVIKSIVLLTYFIQSINSTEQIL